MTNLMRRALLVVGFAAALAVVVVPNWCEYVPAWMRSILGCECPSGGGSAAGGGCSGASEIRTERHLQASAGRRTFEVRR